MRLEELESIVFKSSSAVRKEEGRKIFNDGLVTRIKGKKIESIYHIYGRVTNAAKTREFNTHIKINMLKKKLEGAECTCEDFKEISVSGYTFMCSHLTATSYSFFSLIAKNNSSKAEESKEASVYSTKSKEINSTARLVRKAFKDKTYYEGQVRLGSERLKIEPDNLRNFLEKIESKKTKFKYEHLEFTTRIVHEDLPITFTVKEREGYLLLTTHKKLPISLNSKNDVYLFKDELYLPSKKQIEKYLPLYKKFKMDTEILYRKDKDSYNKLISLLSSITKEINISEEVRNFAANLLKPMFYIYEEENIIYCDMIIDYGIEKINILKENKSKTLIRNYKKEDRILMEVEKQSFIKDKERLMFIGGDEELFKILSKRANSIHSLGTVTFDKVLKDRVIYTSAFIDASLYEKDDFFNFSYNINGIGLKELNNIFAAYKSNKKFFKTMDNGFIDFEDDGVKSFFSLLEILNIDENIDKGQVQIERSRALFIEENIKSNRVGFIKGTEVLREIEEKLSNINNKEITLPINLKGTLREYQVNGFKWLKTLSEMGFGGILADEMGLGKTIQTIAFIVSEENKRTIIVCPTSLIYNWKEEIEKFAPSLKVLIIHGSKSQRVKEINHLSEYDVVLTTYGTLRMDIDYYENSVFDYCIIDEGQNIKNSLAQNTRVIKEIKAKVRFALTGTPIENNLTELWSIFDFIMPGYLFSKETFEEKFIARSEENLENLKQLIKPFLLRRTKKEVMKELPDKIEKKFLVEMTTAQKSVYKAYLKTVREKMKNNSDGKIEVFSYLTKLRQLCLDPSLIIEEYKGGSGKLKVAIDLINNHIESQGKVLLFSQFTSVLDRLSHNLQESGINYLHLDGSTKSKERINMVNEFNSNDDIKVFLISLRAGGTGLNLTSANLVIHFDPWWNPAVENQATDRAHRIGQRNIVEVVKLVAKGTIEEKILLLQEGKKELINSIITGEFQSSNVLNKLSKEELWELFDRD